MRFLGLHVMAEAAMAVVARLPEVGVAHYSMADGPRNLTSARGAGVHRRRGQARRAGLALAAVEFELVKPLAAEVAVALQGHLFELVSNLTARLSCL